MNNHVPYKTGLELAATLIEEVDRNARAYGWEVGMGRTVCGKSVIGLSKDNPFKFKNWRERCESNSTPTKEQ